MSVSAPMTLCRGRGKRLEGSKNRRGEEGKVFKSRRPAYDTDPDSKTDSLIIPLAASSLRVLSHQFLTTLAKQCALLFGYVGYGPCTLRFPLSTQFVRPVHYTRYEDRELFPPNIPQSSTKLVKKDVIVRSQ